MFNQMRARCTFVNTDIKQAVTEVCVMQYFEAESIPGYISDKNQGGTIKNNFSVELNF